MEARTPHVTKGMAGEVGVVEYAARLCPSLTRGRRVLCGCLVLLAGNFAGTIPVVVQPDVSTCHDIARRVVICRNPLHSSTSLTLGFVSTENDRLYQREWASG